MHPVVERFLERPAAFKIGVWAATLLLLAYLFWQFLYSKKLVQYADLENKVQSLSAEISHEKRLIKDLPRVRKEVDELDVKLKIVLAELPDKREIPDLLASISNLAREAGLEVNLFRPMPEQLREFYAEVPVSVAVEGTFHQITTFFDEVGRLARIVNINQINIKDPQVNPDKVGVKGECVATTFRYLEESERVQPAQSGDSKKRKRGGG